MRNELLQWLADWLVVLGPEVLFAVCLLETAVFAGLVLPVGALIAFAAMLAARGIMDPGAIVAAALLGAFIGDQAGFAVGRWFVGGARPEGGSGLLRVWRGALRRTEGLVRRHGLLGVTVARAIPFVRTLMPWFAGRSRVPWPRFLLFDFLGILVWGSIYLGGGFLVGEGWRQVANQYGEVAGLLVVGIVTVALVLVLRGPVRRALLRRTGEREDDDASHRPPGRTPPVTRS
jgi:membrane-associated protein